MKWPRRGTGVKVPSKPPVFANVLPDPPADYRVIDSYEDHNELVIAAAIERGFDVKEVGRTWYFHDGDGPIGGIGGQVTTMVSRSASKVCQSKILTKQMLDAAGVPTLSWRVFEPGDIDAARRLIRASKGSFALKPEFGSQGDGVTCGIDSVDALDQAWRGAQAVREGVAMILEDHLRAVDLRVFVVGDRVVAATVRLPAHVVGNGLSDIATLARDKQAARVQQVYVARFPVVVDEEFLASQGRRSDDIPANGEVVPLCGAANLALGGDTLDHTDALHPELADLAVRAVKAVPGLNIAGVDIMAPSIDRVDGAIVLELNLRPAIGMHHYPSFGASRDVAGAMVDFMVETARG